MHAWTSATQQDVSFCLTCGIVVHDDLLDRAPRHWLFTDVRSMCDLHVFLTPDGECDQCYINIDDVNELSRTCPAHELCMHCPKPTEMLIVEDEPYTYEECCDLIASHEYGRDVEGERGRPIPDGFARGVAEIFEREGGPLREFARSGRCLRDELELQLEQPLKYVWPVNESLFGPWLVRWLEGQ